MSPHQPPRTDSAESAHYTSEKTMITRQKASAPGFSAKSDGLRLPYDILSLIAESLARDGLQRSLAALNIASRPTHEATLAPLYRKMELRDIYDLGYVTGYDVPSGWKYTRYLKIDKTPLAVLQMIDRFVRLHNGKPLDELDITEIFPQLICMRVEDRGYDGKCMTDPFRLELFRPMSLDDIHCLEFDDALYMKDEWNPCYAKQVCIYQLLSNITTIRIREGAHILPSSIEDCAHAARLWETPKTKFSLQIDSEKTDYELECSIARVLDMLAEGTHPEERQPLLGQTARKRRVTLSCCPALFDAFIRVFESRQPFLLEIVVNLLGEGITPSDIQEFLKPLGGIYAHGWVHNDAIYETAEVPFVWIHASAPLACRYDAVAKHLPNISGALAGQLDVFQQPNGGGIAGDPQSGFHAKVLEGWSFGPEDTLEEGEVVFVRNYPCLDAETIEMEWQLDSDMERQEDLGTDEDEDNDTRIPPSTARV